MEEDKEDIMKCEAHDFLEKEIQRCKDNEAELYQLDREQSKVMNEIQRDVTELKIGTKKMEEDVKQLKTDMAEVKTKVDSQAIETEAIKAGMNEIKTEVKEIKSITMKQAEKKHWEPKDYVAVIVAALALIGTIFTATLK